MKYTVKQVKFVGSVTKACRLGRHFCLKLSPTLYTRIVLVTKACRLGRHFCLRCRKRQRQLRPYRHKSLSAWQAFLSHRQREKQNERLSICHKSLSAWQAYLSRGVVESRNNLNWPQSVTKACRLGRHFCRNNNHGGKDVLQNRVVTKACRLGRHFCHWRGPKRLWQARRFVTKACRLGRHFCRGITEEYHEEVHDPVTKACRLGRHFCLDGLLFPIRHFDTESQKPVGLAGISVGGIP